jgi:hypothetical protein
MERGTSLAIPQGSRRFFGLHCQTASICHPVSARTTFLRFQRALTAAAEGKRRSAGQRERINVAVEAPGLLGVAESK